MIKYASIDCEMGGRELKYSLLSLGIFVVTEDFKPVSRLYMDVKPDDGVYVVSGEGMEVNGIQLSRHDRLATPYKKAKSELYDFLKEVSDGGKVKLVPVGHGVQGDIAHVYKSLVSEGTWHSFCTYHYLDTSVVLQYLRNIGKIPLSVDGSVEALAKFFGVHVPGTGLHNALVDAVVTMQIYQKMVELGRGNA